MALPSRLRAGLRLAAVAAVLGLTSWLVYRLVAAAGWEAVREAVRRASPPLLVLAAGLKLGMLGAWAGRWQLTVRRLDRSSPGWVLWAAHGVGVLANHVAPGARLLGGLVRARYLRAFSRLSTARSLGTVLFDQIVHLLTMGALTGLALAAAAVILGRTRLALALAAGLVMTGALLWLLQRYRGWSLTAFLAARAEGRDGGGGRLLRGAGAAAEVVSGLSASRRLWGWAALLGAALFAGNVLSQWAVFHALGQGVDLGLVTVVVALGATAGMLTATPGGLGGTEAAMIALYGLLGVEPSLGAAGTLLFRAVHYAVVLAAGLPAYALLELRLARGGGG